MRYKIIALLLALLALESEPRAAALCAGKGYEGDLQLVASPPSFPALWGESTFPNIRVTPGQGAVAWWYSTDGFGWSLNWAYCTKDKCADAAMLGDIAGALASTDRRAAINAAMAKHSSLPADSAAALAVWCPHWAAIQASRPPLPVYVVAKNGTMATRPAYPYIAATSAAAASRGTKSTARATVSATCDCSVRLTEAGTLYCAVDQARTLVAVCSKP